MIIEHSFIDQVHDLHKLSALNSRSIKVEKFS